MIKSSLIAFSFILLCFPDSSGLSIIKKNNERVIVSGYVKLIGSEPFSRVILEIEKGKIIYLPDSFKIENKNYLYKKITLEGNLKRKELKSANKKHTIIEYYFETYKIIE